MKRIMFDMDGVLAEFTRPFRELAWKRDPSVRVEGHHESTRYDFTDIDPEVVEATWDEIKASRNFWSRLPRLATSLDLDRIARLTYKAKVVFVTARVGWRVDEQTRDWLDSHGIDGGHVIVSPEKGDTARHIGADFAIDDKAGNAVYVSYRSPGTKSYILDYPYNRWDSRVLGSAVRRVFRLSQYLDDVEAAA